MRGRIRDLIRKVAAQGLSPHELALTIAIGVAIGVIPVVWGSTLLCALLAFLLRLNQPGIQAVNYLAYPLQIALLIPFYHLGERIFPRGSAGLAWEWFGKNRAGNLSRLILTTLKALAAWLVVAPPAAILLYLLLRSLFARMPRFRNVAG